VIAQGAGIPIVTRAFVGFVLAVSLRSTEIVRTGIEVVARLQGSAHAKAIVTLVLDRAGISVGARALQGLVMAASSHKAGVLRARIIVVAVQAADAPTQARRAQVSRRAHVGVVTGRLIGHEHAAQRRITSVVGAWVSVDTGEGLDPRLTGFA
jgi:hypothetical protein